MTLNDFKSVHGDRRMGIGSLPVRIGEDGAAALACFTMAIPQIVVIGLMFAWDRPYHAWGIAVLLLLQLVAMEPLLENPRERAPWYNATGITLYVLGMMVSAFAVRAIVA
jgi:chlorophyll synthase